MYKINELAKMSGVSTRTLRYYDEIELLCPKRHKLNDYRIYGEAEVDKLQMILFYRELEMPLEKIKQIINAEGFNQLDVLKKHLTELNKKQTKINQLVTTVLMTIESKEKGYKMTDKSKFEAFKQNEIDQNENNYGDEIRKKYGNKVIEESNQKIKGLSKADYQIYESKNSQIKEILVLLKNSKNYESDLEKKLFELHYEWLSFAIPNLNKEIHKNIAQMYVEDERFKAYYEKITVGGALILRNVIIYHYDKL